MEKETVRTCEFAHDFAWVSGIGWAFGKSGIFRKPVLEIKNSLKYWPKRLYIYIPF